MRAFGEARIAALKAGLVLTPEQEKNWPAFEQAARDYGKLRLDRMSAMRNAAPSNDPVERLRQRAATMQATGQTAWAALSTSGLRALDLPEDVHKVIVLADGDNAGEAAARDCAWRWTRRGRRVRIARPPQGLDFNDMLVGHAPCIEDGAQ